MDSGTRWPSQKMCLVCQLFDHTCGIYRHIVRCCDRIVDGCETGCRMSSRSSSCSSKQAADGETTSFTSQDNSGNCESRVPWESGPDGDQTTKGKRNGKS